MNVLGDLLFRLGVDLASLNRDMRAARSTVDGAMTGIARSAGMATRAMQGFVGALSVRELARISDQFKTINATLEIATRSAESGAYAYKQVFEVAMRSGQALDSVAITYRRFAENSRELGISQDEVARATETVAKAMALSGGSYQSTQAALLQFSQALASGVLRGQELNSVLEQSPRLARLIADGMKVPIGSLRSLAEEGKITTDVLVEALKNQGDVIDEEFNKLPMTFARAINNLQSGFTNLVGIFESGTGVFGLLANGIDFIAQNLDKLVNVVIAASLIGFSRLLTTIVSLGAAKLAMAANVGVLTSATVALNGALALVGGPAGAVIMAISALYAFRGELGLVSEAYAKNISMLDEFKAGMEATGGFFSSIAILGTMNPFLSLEEHAEKYKKEIEDLQEQQARFGDTMSKVLGISLDLEIAQKRLAYTETLLAKATRDANNARAFAATAMDTHTAAYLKMTGEADKYIKSLQNEFDLIGLTNEERIISIGMRKLEELGMVRGTEVHEKYVAQLIEMAQRIRIKTEYVELSKQAAQNAKREAEEYQRLTENLTEQIAKMKIENETFGQGNEERERAIFLREAENLKIADRNRLVAEYDEVFAIKKANLERKKANEDRLNEEKKYAKEVEKINDQIGQSLTDALMNGGMNARDFLVNMFKTMILRPILQPVITGVVGSLGLGAAGAALAGSGAEGGANAMGQASGLIGLVNAAKSAVEMFTGGFQALGTTVTSAAQKLGATLILESAPGSAFYSMGQSLASSATALGAIVSYTAAMAAGIMGGKLISGQFKVGGSSYIMPIIGTILGGPIGGAIGGLINRAFGMGPKETTSEGYDLTLAVTGAITTGFEKWEQAGGWFRGSRSGKELTVVAQETVDFFSQTSMAVGASVAGMAQMFGASLDTINNFKLDIVIETLDATKEQIEEQITGAFAFMETSLVDYLIPGIYAFAAASDKTAADVLKRLTNSITTVNLTFETLGYSLYEVSLQGASAAYKMVELFGGFENFTKATSFYYENFYSAQEKVNFQTEQLTKIFGSLGKTLPDTKDAFRALVEAAKASGDDQLFATLMQLAPAFNTLQTSMAQLGTATGDTVNSIGESANNLQNIARERYSLETELLQLQNNQTELRRRELEVLDSSNRGLQEQIWTLEETTAAQQELRENTAFFFENFFSLQEQTNKQTGTLAETFAALNQELPATKDAFRALVESAQAAGDESLVSALLRLAPEFVSLQNNLNTLGQSVGSTVDSIGNSVRDLQAIAQERYQLETQLLKLQNDTAEIRRRELAQIDETNKELQEQIWQTEDQNTVNQERIQLENQLLQLQGDTTELRRRELEAIGPANRALQEQIWAMQDSAAASESAADAARDAAAAEKERRNAEDEAAQARALTMQQVYEGAVARTDKAFSDLSKTLEFELNKQLEALEFNLKVVVGGMTGAIDQITNGIKLLQTASSNTDFAFNRVTETINRETQLKIAAANEQFDAQKAAIEKQITAQESVKDAASKIVDEIKGLFDTLKSSIAEVTSESQIASMTQAAMQTISSALASSRAGGGLGNVDVLKQAIGVATSSVSSASYVSTFESDRANALLRNQLIELQGYTSDQLTVAERQLIAAESQVEILKNQLTAIDLQRDQTIAAIEKQATDQIAAFQKQIDEIRGLHETTMSMSEMISEFNKALLIEQQYSNELQQLISLDEKVDRELMIKFAEDQIKFLQEQITIAEKQYELGVEAANAYKETTLAYYEDQINLLRDINNSVLSMTEAIYLLELVMRNERAESQQLAEATKTPAFSNGGMYTGGMALVGERGPELIDFANPAMVYSNSQLKSYSSGGETASEIRAMREENRSQARAMVTLQARMTKMIERWDGDGLPEERVVTA